MAISLTRRPGALPSLLATVLAGFSQIGCSGGGPSDGLSPVTPPVATVPAPPPESDPQPPPSAATDTIVRLQWNPSTESISGYIVYYGSTPEDATNLAVQLAQGEFDAQAPSVSFNAGRDLGLNHGESVCFRLRAYGAGDIVSDPSDAACSTV